jgi:glyoxylase-like metal-dependent hydrolase (beta-lactamase superfamily II)/rhodanese-related sulfurtransferase
MRVEVIATPELGDRSYLVHDGRIGVVVDPQRDIERVTEIADGAGVHIDLVLETHIHNDYVTGGYELARRRGARYALNGADAVEFDRVPIADRDVLTAGSLIVRVVATPGHTDTHLSYVVTDSTQPGQPPAVFTGGSLLFGSVGRTDLVDPARTDELTHAQYHSARRLAEELPDPTPIYPTHGFGSFCSSGAAAGGSDSTIGVERGRNDALTNNDEDAFVERLIANLTAYPTYYAHMGVLNRRGPGAPDLSTPAPVDATELAKRISAGEWVVDLRDRVAYAADHFRGTVSIALGDKFTTYVGWLTPWGAPLTLLGESPDQIVDAQRQLARIGVDQLAGAAAGPLDELTATESDRRAYPRATFAQARKQMGDGDVMLDVRRDDEHADNHIAGSIHIPLAELESRVDELPAGRLWVHCAAGFRSSIAASLIDRAGRDVVYIDDDYPNATAAGFVTA